MADNVLMRDYNGMSQVMRTTNDGITNVPHHIVNPVSLLPVIPSNLAFVDSAILSGAACSLAELDTYIDATGDAYLLIMDRATVPVNGTIDGTYNLVKCFKIAGDSWFTYSPKIPIKLANGCVVVLSSTAPFTQTKSAHAFFSSSIALPSGAIS